MQVDMEYTPHGLVMYVHYIINFVAHPFPSNLSNPMCTETHGFESKRVCCYQMLPQKATVSSCCPDSGNLTRRVERVV